MAGSCGLVTHCGQSHGFFQAPCFASSHLYLSGLKADTSKLTSRPNRSKMPAEALQAAPCPGPNHYIMFMADEPEAPACGLALCNPGDPPSSSSKVDWPAG